ncbi:MAG: DUF4862 family protein [Georgenia sp.]
MRSSPSSGPFLGAYALAAGLEPEAVAALYRLLAELPIAGLELPLSAADGRSSWFHTHVRDDWDLVVTCIPTTMQRLGIDPRYGLASRDDEGRRAALADVAAALVFAAELAEASGRARVRAVQVHSAPRRENASVEALARSFDALGEAELSGARLVLEHCDAARPGRLFHKGFLEIDEEIAMLADHDIAMAINWGRSAIEGRSPETPVEHVRAAAEAGVLGGVMFSGVADHVTAWGSAWDDSHMAPRGADPALEESAESLLGSQQIAETLDAAGPNLDYVGVKVTVRPEDAGATARVAVALAALELLETRR